MSDFSTSTTVLLFACPLAWALLDLLRKSLSGYGRAVPLTFLLVTVQLPMLLAWAFWAGDWSIGGAYWLPAVLSLGLNILANLAYMQSVRLSPMSATLPLLSLTPVFTTLFGIPLLGEVPSAVQACGIGVVVLGALLLNTEAADGWSPMAWIGALRREPGSRFMVAVAILWSIAPPLDKLAVRHAGIAFHALFLSAGIALALLILLLASGRVGEARVPARGWWLLLGAAFVALIALGVQLELIQRVWVGLVETFKRGLGAVLALAFGRLIFGEAVSRRRLGSVALMIVGVRLVMG